jgi:hypothetical protein
VSEREREREREWSEGARSRRTVRKWPWVPSDLEPRITELERTSSNLGVRRWQLRSRIPHTKSSSYNESLLFIFLPNLGPPLWSSGQSSWLQIHRSGFDSLRYQTFLEVVGLERVPLNLVSTIEELLRRKNNGSGLENRDYGRKGSLAPTLWHPLSAKLALTSPTSGGCSVGIVRSQTKAMEFSLVSFRICISHEWHLDRKRNLKLFG